MKASKLIEELQDMVKIHGDLELVYFETASDANVFTKAIFEPVFGTYEKNKFSTSEDIKLDEKVIWLFCDSFLF